MRIDAHQHFWTYEPLRDAWITEAMEVLRRDFLPPQLGTLLAAHRFGGCVAVQADQSNTETRFLLSLAAEHPFIQGVVGWIDLRAPDLAQQLAAWAPQKKLKGFRHIVQAESAGFVLQPEFLRGVATIGRAGYTYDLLVFHHQLEDAVAFARQLPDQKIVIDHLAKPDIKSQEFSEWARHMQRLAMLPNVWCKVSGLVTEADWSRWKSDDFAPYLGHVVDCFGIERVMYGSDWPVCLLAASYERQLEVVERYFERYSPTDKQKLFGENAETFYNLRA